MKENKKALECIEYLTKIADEVQKQVLSEILSQNWGGEYLQLHCRGRCTDSKSFKKFVPIITYENIQPDNDQVVNGDKSPVFVLTPF